MSPASSYQYLSAPEPQKRDDDASSTCSTDSRRPSVNAAATEYVNDQSGMDETVKSSYQRSKLIRDFVSNSLVPESLPTSKCDIDIPVQSPGAR